MYWEFATRQKRHALRCSKHLYRAPNVEITLPVTFLGFSHAPESYVLYLQAAAGRAAF